MRFFYFLLILSIAPCTQAYFYPDSYQQSRNEFRSIRSELKKKGLGEFSEITLRIPSDTKQDLSIDGFHWRFAEMKPRNLMIITSGIHGVEAFTGAAIQMEFIRKHLNPDFLKNTGFLILHSINPYGYALKRRVDENNVDLNRNFSASEEQFSKKDPAYENFNSFLNPIEPVSASAFANLSLFAKSIYKLLTQGRKAIAQTALGGQYQNPEGIYFGGSESSVNATLLAQVFSRVGQDYDNVVHIDLHTGYGERGRLHFFSSRKVMALDGFDKLFHGFSIDAGSDDDFYETSGDFSGFTRQIFSDKKNVIPMTFEFGTLDSQTTLGGFYSLRNLIWENQGHLWGYVNESSENKVKKSFLEMFNPSNIDWRDQVVESGAQTLKTVTERLQDF